MGRQNLVELDAKCDFYRGAKTYKGNDNITRILTRLNVDPVYFAKMFLDFSPFWYQEKLMRATAKRIAACWGRQTGKTHCIGAKAVHFAFTNPKTTTLVVSRGLRQSMIMFQRIIDFIMASPVLRRSVIRQTRTLIVLKNGAKIVALPCSQNGANLRGYTADMVIMDEAAFMPEPVIASVIFPMLATTELKRGTGIAIMISTPWDREHIFYRCFTNPDWFVMRVQSSDCPLITDKFLNEQKALVGELRYETEYEAKFRDDATSLFTQHMIRGVIEYEWYDKRVKKGLPELLTDLELHQLDGKHTGAHAMGIDIGKRRDYTVVSVFKKDKRVVASDVWREITAQTGPDIVPTETIRPAWILVYQKEFKLGTDLTPIVEHCVWLTLKFDIQFAAMDQTQIGEMPFEVIKSSLPLMEGVILSMHKKQSVMQSFVLLVEQRRIGLPHADQYRANLTQMAEQRYGYSKVNPRVDDALNEIGVMKYWHPQGRKDDRLWSMALGIYAVVLELTESGAGVL